MPISYVVYNKKLGLGVAYSGEAGYVYTKLVDAEFTDDRAYQEDCLRDIQNGIEVSEQLIPAETIKDLTIETVEITLITMQ